jgi:hypothetical protein
MIEAAGLKQPTLQDLQTLKLEASRSPGWLAHYIYMVVMGILTLVILSAISYGSHKYYLYYLRINATLRIPVGHSGSPIELHDLSSLLYHQQHQ